MDANGIIMIVVAVLSVFFGYAFGWFEWGRKLKALQQAEKQPAQETKAKDEPITVPPPAPLPREEPALLSLRQANGRLRVELEGTPLEAETISVDQRKRLIDVVTRMRPWIEGRAATPTPPAPVPVPQTLSSPQPTPTRPAAVPAKKEEAPQSMVAQIDEILQQRIVNTPLELIGLRMEETPGGGVTVVVGSKRYAGVGEVPDPEVQNALRTAIALWEKKFTPGL